MSKLNQDIERIAKDLCLYFSVDFSELQYAGDSIKTALDRGFLAADIVFQMQHLASTYNCYVDEFIAIDISDNPESELYDVFECTLATTHQKNALREYYEQNHPRYSPSGASLQSFLTYASVRSALFNWKEPSKTRLAYASMLVALDGGVVVIDNTQVAMRTLQTPNRLMHLALRTSMTSQPDTQPTTTGMEPSYEAEPS